MPIEQLDYMPAVDSMDYYGIIYIVYFSWCGIICATGVWAISVGMGIATVDIIKAVAEGLSNKEIANKLLLQKVQ